jgi:CheY-like chemotaxis protein
MEAQPDRVLIVDDNEVNRDLLAKRLQRQGYGVTVVSNGLEALEMRASMSLEQALSRAFTYGLPV